MHNFLAHALLIPISLLTRTHSMPVAMLRPWIALLVSVLIDLCCTDSAYHIFEGYFGRLAHPNCYLLSLMKLIVRSEKMRLWTLPSSHTNARDAMKASFRFVLVLD